MPNAGDGDEQVAVTGITEECGAERLWKWLHVEEPIDPDDMETLDFRLAALPEWKRKQIKLVDVNFTGGGGLTTGGEAQ